jgi:hypothetical protein
MFIGYIGTARGFRLYALPALRRAAMRGMSIQNDSRQIQRELRSNLLPERVHGRAAG